MSSCSTAKQATKDSTTVTKKEVVKLPENISAEVEVEINYGEQAITLPGTLHMKRDKCIRLEVQVPLLGTEVGRVEFTPEYILVIDRMNKRYAKESYDKISALSNASVDFTQLQSLFWDDTDKTSFTKSRDGLGSLTWTYADFQKIETKDFPCSQTITITSKDKNGKLSISCSELNTSSNWETLSSISSKYTKVETDDIMNMLK